MPAEKGLLCFMRISLFNQVKSVLQQLKLGSPSKKACAFKSGPICTGVTKKGFSTGLIF